LYEELVAHGVKLSEQGKMPLRFMGKLASGSYSLRADVSSQFIGGLLIALPLLDGGSSLELVGAIQSLPYIKMTLDVLAQFGIIIKSSGNLRRFEIAGSQKMISPGKLSVEGDWSNSSYWLAAAALGNSVYVSGLNPNTAQGDMAITDLIRGFGASVKAENGSISVWGRAASPQIIDLAQTPDLAPAIAVIASGVKGESHIINAERLRIKESDRILSIVAMINDLGGCAHEREDGFSVLGTGGLRGGRVFAEGDHRIVMSAAAASVICDGDVIIEGAEAVNKSYPGFFEDFSDLGGNVKLEV
jgi:3-phosphoshikimate 1-carboxyvinyltransferase